MCQLFSDSNFRYPTGSQCQQLIRSPKEIFSNHSFARFALEARANLCPNANPVADLDSRDFWPHLRSNTSNFMASDKRQDGFAPTARDAMMIRGTDSAIFDRDVDIEITGGLGFEIDKFEIGITLVVMNGIAL